MSDPWGGPHGTVFTDVDRAGPRVTTVSLRTGSRLDQVGPDLADGSPTADTVTYTAPAGWQVAGFYGRSGAEVDRLGLIYIPVA